MISSPDQASSSLSTFYRLSAVGLLSGCSLLAVGDVVRVAAGTDPGSPLLATGWFLQAFGAMLAVLGIPGFSSRLYGSTGMVGVAGLVGLTAFLFVFGVFGGLLHALAVPSLLRQGATRPVPVDLAYFAAAVLAMVGSLALSLSALRAHVIPKGAAALVLVGGLALFAGHPVGMYAEDLGLVLLMSGLGWMGFAFERRPV